MTNPFAYETIFYQQKQESDCTAFQHVMLNYYLETVT